MVSIHGPLGYEANTLTTAPLRWLKEENARPIHWPTEKVAFFNNTSGDLDQRELLERDEVDGMDRARGCDKCSGAWFRSTDLWVMSPTR